VRSSTVQVLSKEARDKSRRADGKSQSKVHFPLLRPLRLNFESGKSLGTGHMLLSLFAFRFFALHKVSAGSLGGNMV